MGFDWNFILNQMPLFYKATILTFQVAIISIFFSIIVSIIINFIFITKIKLLCFLAKLYVEIARNTPFLVQLFFLYFGLPAIGIKLSSFSVAIIGLSFLGGAYIGESIRAGIEAVPKAQIESAKSIGLTKWQMLRFIILPQAINISIPSLIANGIFLIKETSVASAISLPELLHTTTGLIAIYYKTSEMLFVLTFFYIALFVPISILLSILERRLKYGQFGTSVSY